MRKIVAVDFIFVMAFVFFGDVASASPFSACLKTELNSVEPTSESLSLLAVRIGQTFEATVGDGLRDIDINIRCIETNGQSAPPLEYFCAERRAYFLKTIPAQWTKFRRLIALSSYSQRFTLHKDDRRPFNTELLVPSHARANEAIIQPLQPDELLVADKEWSTQWALAKKTVLVEIEERLNRPVELGSIDGSARRELKQAKQLLETWPPHMVYRTQNTWAKKVFTDIDAIFFKLNRKRTIQLLARFPILAHLKDQEVSPGSIITALRNQRDRLKEESNRVSVILRQISVTKSVAPTDLQSLFDYHLVADLALSNHPELCTTATSAFQIIERRSQIKSALLILTMVGLTPFIPISWTLIGASAMQSVAIYDALQKETSSKNLAYGFSSPDLAIKSAEDLYLDRTSLENEWILTASIVTGLPLMRLSKFAIRSLPAVKQVPPN